MVKSESNIKYFLTPLVILILIVINCTSDKFKENPRSIQNPLRNSKNWKSNWENESDKKELFENISLLPRIKQCLEDSNIVIRTKSLLDNFDEFNKTRAIGDINNDGIIDSILVIPELYIRDDNSYEDGASIVFLNKNIPRIRIDVPCVDLDYIFMIEDIDENGINEIGQYYTSCVSRFKSLNVLALQNTDWKIKGRVTFDTWYPAPPKEERIKKISKNKLSIREITEENNEVIDKWMEFDFED